MFLPQPIIAGGIFLHIMRIAVNLDDNALGGTEEIRNAIADNGLSAEFMSIELRGSKVLPQSALRLGGIAAKVVRA